MPLGSEKEAKDAAGSTELEGSVVPARRKLTISCNFPLNNVKAHVESAGARRRGRNNTAKLSADELGRRRRECVNARRRRHDDFSEKGEATAVNRQQAMNALKMEE